jgi:hypothetical protein
MGVGHKVCSVPVESSFESVVSMYATWYDTTSEARRVRACAAKRNRRLLYHYQDAARGVSTLDHATV